MLLVLTGAPAARSLSAYHLPHTPNSHAHAHTHTKWGAPRVAKQFWKTNRAKCSYVKNGDAATAFATPGWGGVEITWRLWHI